MLLGRDATLACDVAEQQCLVKVDSNATLPLAILWQCSDLQKTLEAAAAADVIQQPLTKAQFHDIFKPPKEHKDLDFIGVMPVYLFPGHEVYLVLAANTACPQWLKGMPADTIVSDLFLRLTDDDGKDLLKFRKMASKFLVRRFTG